MQTYNYGQKKRAEKEIVEKGQLQAQLSLLRAKIDPHFLFNTINNIDVLIETNPEKASVFLKKLGEILRFMLYRTNEDFIPLAEEIDYISKYIELQRIRSTNANFVNFKVTGDAKGRFIAPMVFIIFVENAMKYVADRKTDNAVEINLAIEKGVITFKITNTISHKFIDKEREGGVGLTSVKQRLKLLYPESHHLNINADNHRFSVELKITTE